MMVIDAGAVRAYSAAGKQWRVQPVAHRELHWDQAPKAALLTRQQMQQYMQHPPPLPFARGDLYELWLLERDSGLPLALLDSAHAMDETDGDITPVWRAFTSESQTFHGELDGPAFAARDLIYMIQAHSRPQPMAQWFRRQADGSGVGLSGLRIDGTLYGRHLPATAFPELLIREEWPDSVQEEMARAYHQWLGGYLLAHEDLAEHTRQRLEQHVLVNPQPLLHSFQQLPLMLDRQRCRAAWVAARMQSGR